MPFSSNSQGKQLFNNRGNTVFNNRVAKPIRGGGASGISTVSTSKQLYNNPNGGFTPRDVKRQQMDQSSTR